jgi:hypothetical protein
VVGANIVADIGDWNSGRISAEEFWDKLGFNGGTLVGGWIGGRASCAAFNYGFVRLGWLNRTLTANEMAEVQSIADRFNVTIDVVGSRAAGRGRNVETNLPKGKGRFTRSDIDFRFDTRDSRAGEIIEALKGVGNGAGSAGMKWGPEPTYPPCIRFVPKAQ